MPRGSCVLFNAAKANDWTHGNSVSLTYDGNLIYSARHQDLVYKIAYANGAGDGHVIWKLGKDGDFAWALLRSLSLVLTPARCQVRRRRRGLDVR